jgi:hypothetical protein
VSAETGSPASPGSQTPRPQKPWPQEPWTAGSLDELIAGATDRTPLRPEDSRSGATFERLTINGQAHFLKLLSADTDWIMRCTGNTTNWEFKVWNAGIYHRAPDVIDHAMVGMALEGTGSSARLAQLMTDRGDDLVEPGDCLLPIEQHRRFIDHMASFHATFMGWRDDLGLQDLGRRFLFFAPEKIAQELLVDEVPGPVAVAHQGWAMLPERAPRLNSLVAEIHAHPDDLAASLRTTPGTFVAGDWKLGNVGSRTDGRTVLLDWAYPGEAPPCWDLVWYLALNRARLPESKEQTIASYRSRLEHHGVDTAGWWDRQLGLSMVGIAATFAWEKAVGEPSELAWWEAAALEGARWLS